MTTVFMSIAARSSELDDLPPETKVQTEGHTLTPVGGQNGPEDLDAFESAPSWSPARTPALDQPETQYCLEIQVVPTEDDKVTPPPSYKWQAPIVKEMVCEGRTGLTEAIVTGLGRAVLFLWMSFFRRRTEFG